MVCVVVTADGEDLCRRWRLGRESRGEMDMS